MSHRPLPTRFAPAERAAAEELQRQIDYFAGENLTRHLLDALPSILLVLNRHRQIVYANRSLLDLLGAREEDFAYGRRPGEALHCVNAGRGPGGCGTAESCAACGMVAAILVSLAGCKEVRECRFLRYHDGCTEAIDLLVWATPLDFQSESFTVFSLSDISHEKRRRALEKIFFHDVLNVVGSIKGLSEVLREYDPADRHEIYAMIQAAAEQTIEEIEAQRLLAAAESRELIVRPGVVALPEFLPQLIEFYRHHEVARGRWLDLVEPLPEAALITDRTLLSRILGNMIKNALEAAQSEETVTVGCRLREGEFEFRVCNPGMIPAPTQLEIFQRSFSTKGRGRGLGTYSMKVLSEYLQGEVSFTSSEEAGTVFRLLLPLSLS